MTFHIYGNFFLVADMQIYKRLCPSVGPSVGPWTGVGKWENEHFRCLFGQRPRRERSPVEHRGTFVRPFVGPSIEAIESKRGKMSVLDTFWAAAPKGRCPVGHRGEFPDVRPSFRTSPPCWPSGPLHELSKPSN